MTKREAKKVMLAYLASRLDPVIYGDFIVEQADNDPETIAKLLAAVDELLEEMERRAE